MSGAPQSASAAGALIILNAASGTNRARASLQALRAAATACGIECEFLLINKPERLAGAIAQARQGPRRRVIAVGGDGTLRAVAAALVESGKEFGAIPLGTFNYFAREYGLPAHPPDALTYALRGEARPITVGELNGIPFLNNASVGLYPKVLEIREGTYRRFGRSRLAAYWSVILALARFDVNLAAEIEIAGALPTRLRTPLIFVGRNGYQIAQFHLPGSECVANHQLAAYVLPATGRAALLSLAARLLLGGIRPQQDLKTFCAAELRVRLPGRRWTAALDGERLRVSSPLTFRVREKALLAVVPERHDG